MRYCVAKGESPKQAFLAAREECAFLEDYKSYIIENNHHRYSLQDAIESIDLFVSDKRGRQCRALVLERPDHYFFFTDPEVRDFDNLADSLKHLVEVGTPLSDRVLKGIAKALENLKGDL